MEYCRLSGHGLRRRTRRCDMHPSRTVEINAVDTGYAIECRTRLPRIEMPVVNDEQLAAVGRFNDRVVSRRGDSPAEIGNHLRIVLVFGPRAERVRSCRNTDSIMGLSRIIARIRHVINSSVPDDERAFVATVHVAADKFPRLVSLPDQPRFAVKSRKVSVLSLIHI